MGMCLQQVQGREKHHLSGAGISAPPGGYARYGAGDGRHAFASFPDGLARFPCASRDERIMHAEREAGVSSEAVSRHHA